MFMYMRLPPAEEILLLVSDDDDEGELSGVGDPLGNKEMQSEALILVSV